MFKYQISRKSIQWEPSCSTWVERQTERCDKANRHFSQFCKHAWKLWKTCQENQHYEHVPYKSQSITT